jgi:hypothetical protein
MLVFLDVCEIACVPEHPLVSVHLTRKRVLHPGHKMGLVGQTCDDGGHMPRPFQSNKCAVTTPLLTTSVAGHRCSRD